MTDVPLDKRGGSSIGRQILAGLVKNHSRKVDSPIYHLVALGRNLTVGGVALILLWAWLFRPPLGADQTRQIVQAIERGAAAQVESSEKVAAKLEILTERIADQTAEIARVAGSKGCTPCPKIPPCPDLQCQPCPDPPRSISVLKPSPSSKRREPTR